MPRSFPHAPKGHLNSDLITSSLGNVSHPSVGVVSRFVVHSKETNVNSAGGKHRNLKFGTDGWSIPWLGPCGWHQIHVCLNVPLGLAWNRFPRQTIACCSGSYLARPLLFLIFAFDVFFGTGILMTTLVANNWSEKLAMIFKLMETLQFEATKQQQQQQVSRLVFPMSRRLPSLRILLTWCCLAPLGPLG